MRHTFLYWSEMFPFQPGTGKHDVWILYGWITGDPEEVDGYPPDREYTPDERNDAPGDWSR